NPSFCAKARLLHVEAQIRNRQYDGARTLLDAIEHDATVAGSNELKRANALLRARLARSVGLLDAAVSGLNGAAAIPGASSAETARIDIERGYLALAANDRRAALAALQRGREALA